VLPPSRLIFPLDQGEEFCFELRLMRHKPYSLEEGESIDDDANAEKQNL
jgi:hypothetical protein